jgi:hypothetical protein
MSLWMERLNEMQHYQALLEDAEQERLAQQATRNRGARKDAWCRAMKWLGSQLSGWGKQLQERYGHV